MKVGLFDHLERADRPLAQQYDERLQFLAAADEAGFYCAHVAEHHCTPLNMVPAPSVYLGAIARTDRGFVPLIQVAGLSPVLESSGGPAEDPLIGVGRVD